MTTYHETGKGRDAMAAGPAAGLMLQDRRILILADGRRTLDQLRRMLGEDILPRVDRLLREGYLAPIGAAASTPVPTRAPAPAPTQAAMTTQPAAQRRSLAASKMYVLDMLQLQRSVEAAEAAAAIRVAEGTDALLEALFQGLRVIFAGSKPSYGERVFERFCAGLPEEALPRAEALRPQPSAGPRPQLSIVA